MRGQDCNIKEFLKRSKVLDDILIDMCSIVDRFEKNILQNSAVNN